MPLSLPNLDDRTFSDLAAEMQSLIPRYTKQWTNFNPADPGITFLELLCWLTESVLYRLDQVSECSYLTFLELLGVEHAAPQVVVTFQLAVDESLLTNQDEPRWTLLADGFTIPRGTRVAGIDPSSGEELIFETLFTIKQEEGEWDDEQKLLIYKVQAVHTVEVEHEFLGVSDESPKQRFFLQQQPLFINTNGDDNYPGNPCITISMAEEADEVWQFKTDLFDSASPDDPECEEEKTGEGLCNSGLKHYTVERLAGCVRFGDGKLGKIPPKGARIFCTYRKIGGKQGNLEKERIIQLKDTALFVDRLGNPVKVRVTNAYPAAGGVDSETPDDLLASGLAQLQERFRAVSQTDFGELAMQAAPGKTARVKVLPGKNLEKQAAAEGHVSVVILPAAVYVGLPDEATEITPEGVRSTHTYEKMSVNAKSTPAKCLYSEIACFLDVRRLITTKLHVVAPEFADIDLEITVKAKTGVVASELKAGIQKQLAFFLDPYLGGEKGTGWPFGKAVYRSELYQQIERVEGVDYVKRLVLNGQEANNFIEVKEDQLVCPHREIRVFI